MPNWGNCHKNRHRSKNTGDKLTGDVLKRCDENCYNFKPARQSKKNAASYSRLKKA
jgi:hypothetical protein